MRYAYLLSLLLATPAAAEISTPARPVTDPKAIVSPSDAHAAAVPIDDLVFSRGVLSAAWSADGRQLFISTNLTGRYNIWRADAAGSWPVQLAQSDDGQDGLTAAPDGRTLFYLQDKGGNERYDIYDVPTAGGASRNLTNSPQVAESALLMAPDGRSIALSHKRGDEGQINLAVLSRASGVVRLLTHEADPQWSWQAVAWIDGGRGLIANRAFVDGSVSEVWKVDVASGKATKLLGKPEVLYSATGATADGSAIALTTNAQTNQLHAAVFVPASGAVRTLAPTPWEQSSGAVSPDGRSMVVSTSEDGRETLELVDLATLRRRRCRCRSDSTGPPRCSRSPPIPGACWCSIRAPTARPRSRPSTLQRGVPRRSPIWRWPACRPSICPSRGSSPIAVSTAHWSAAS